MRRTVALTAAGLLLALVMGALSTKLATDPGTSTTGPTTNPTTNLTASVREGLSTDPDALAPTENIKEYPYNKVAVKEFPELFDRGFTCYGLTDPPTEVTEAQVVASAAAQSPATPRRPELTKVSAAVYDCILTCLPTSATWSSVELTWAENCINTNLSQLPEVLTSEEYFKAAEVLLHDHPQISDPCYIGAHQAGMYYASKSGERYVALLMQVPSQQKDCLYGFMHGVLDVVGSTKASAPVFTNLARYCATLKEPTSLECAQALGRAAWDAYKTANDAVQVGCGEYGATQQLFNACVSGIIVRRYERSDLSSDPTAVNKLVSDGVNLCGTEWPKRLTTGTVDPVLECWRNIPHQMWFPISLAQRASELNEADLADYIAKVTSTCLANKSAVQTQSAGQLLNVCDERTGYYLSYTANSDEKRLGKLCAYSVGDQALCRQGLKSVPQVN